MGNYIELVQKEFGALKTRFGYVSKKNVIETAERVAKKVQNDVGAAQKELSEYRGKTAEEMAKLTSEKDKLVLNLKSAQEKLQKRTTTRILDNGNKLECTTKPSTGASQEVEKAIVGDEEKVVRISTRTADGHLRTVYKDVSTGETTFMEDSIRPNDFPTRETMLKEEIERLKGLKKEKGVPLTENESKPIVKSTIFAKNGDRIETMTDGTVRRIHTCYPGAYEVEIKNGSEVVERVRKDEFGKLREVINGDNKIFQEESAELSRTRNYTKIDEYREVMTREEVTLSDGTKGVAERVPDEFGMYENKDVMKVTYPETSTFSSAEIKRKVFPAQTRSGRFSDRGQATEVVLKTKKGETIVLSDFVHGVPTKSQKVGEDYVKSHIDYSKGEQEARKIWEDAKISELDSVMFEADNKINDFMSY